MKTESSESTLSLTTDSFRIKVGENGLAPRPITYGVVADIWDDYFDVWGESKEVNGHRDFIYFKVPAGIKSGSYPLSQFDDKKRHATDTNKSSIWVYAIFGDGAGVLVPDTGKIDLTWDLATRKFSANFKFDAEVGAQVYNVTEGRINVVVPEAQLSKAEGSVSASFTPQLPDELDTFVAENVYLKQASDGDWVFDATQHVNGELHLIRLIMSGDSLPARTIYGYHLGAFLGEDMSVSRFDFNQTQRTLEAEFSFSFVMSGVRYKVQNVVVDIRY